MSWIMQNIWNFSIQSSWHWLRRSKTSISIIGKIRIRCCGYCKLAGVNGGEGRKMREKTGGIFLVPGTRQDNATEDVGGTPSLFLSSAKFMRSQKNQQTHTHATTRAEKQTETMMVLGKIQGKTEGEQRIGSEFQFTWLHQKLSTHTTLDSN